MHRVVLGTAGHIDHGKTALVEALTGTDTDRLPEEKARGITIDLGFAELEAEEGLQLGVVDVPGHEDFVRTMVAGASGMDVVLLVVAADEGVMPQTREHLDIVRLLEVPVMVVALTKIDLVDPEWLGLVQEDVRDLLAGTPYAAAPLVATSAPSRNGVPELRKALLDAARKTRERLTGDLARLPLDRVFTVQGTGTVVTGTLASGALSVGERVRVLPDGPEARIRSLQVHGRDVRRASAGERTAVALASTERDAVERGAVLVSGQAWKATWMLTVRVEMLDDASWMLERGQRIRVHVGTQEVLARCVPFGTDAFGAGERGWAQLRLEAPSVARAGDRVVLRSYSPVQTIAGGVVVEPTPPKRKRLEPEVEAALQGVLDDRAAVRAAAAVSLGGWQGAALEALPLLASCSPEEVAQLSETLVRDGALSTRGRLLSREVAREAGRRVEEALDGEHAAHPLRPTVALERLRAAVPPWSAPGLADAVIERLAADGVLEVRSGGVRRPGFQGEPDAEQGKACQALLSLYGAGGLAPPFLGELPEALGTREDLPELLRHLEAKGQLVRLDAELYVDAEALSAGAAAVTSELTGRTGLGPADFREVLPVSRRHLMPLLSHLDGLGVTRRREGLRDVLPQP